MEEAPDITIYFGKYGSDEGGNGTIKKPYRSMEKAYNSAPKIVKNLTLEQYPPTEIKWKK